MESSEPGTQRGASLTNRWYVSEGDNLGRVYRDERGTPRQSLELSGVDMSSRK